MAIATSRREFLRLTGIGSAGVAASQLAGLGFNIAFAKESAARRKLEGTTQTASICPYCAVGCGTMVASRKAEAGKRKGDTVIVNIEGNPDSPISTGSLCPKGAATFQLAVNDLRVEKVMRRKPNATDWDKDEISYDAALDRIAELVQKTREETFVERDTTTGKLVNQTTGIFALGGATNDNEENYLICKVMRMVGVTRIENQARI